MMAKPPGQEPDGSGVGVPPLTVGAQLRRARVMRDESIGAIADYLRIKPEYLFAFEQERHEQLPPLAYALGFLQSYAAYLGLDGLALREAYRQEMLDKLTPQLSMPQPLTEAHSPPWPIILGALLAALLIYTLWQQLNRPNAVPIAPLEPPRPSSIYQPKVRLVPAPSQQVITAPALAPLVLHKLESLKTSLPQPAAQAAPAVSTSPAATLAPAMVANQSSANSQPSNVTVPVAAATGRRFGDTSRPTRRVIHTEAPARVTIRNAQQRLIFSRMLQPGDTYHVPDRPGLLLSSSHPASLIIVQDGKFAQKPGEPGSVTFDLRLDEPGKENP